jgi:hypothetical protein
MLPTWNSSPEFFAIRRRNAQAPTPQAPTGEQDAV